MISDWLDVIGSDEEFTQAAADGMQCAMLAGYGRGWLRGPRGSWELTRSCSLGSMTCGLRLPNCVRRSSRRPGRPTATDFDRDLLRRLHEAGNEHTYDGEREVLDALIADDTPERWFTGERFLRLAVSEAMFGRSSC